MNARDKAVHSATPGLQPDANPGRGPSTSSMPAIRVEGLGKEYIIGSRERVPRTFREMLGGAFSAPLRRLRRLRGQVGKEERFWALQDVSFEIAPGEVVGIIGRNGAGKSTLLKILSRITEPTRGRVEIRGRVSSLLEVGTGFHPELTGRENIYLNGAILGMTRREIGRKFDEIVTFAEIEKFLDTAVKYYSSGMYVRLAFSVAAHLEPEVLLVDEVLAVGDAEFQNRCLGKIKEVSGGGRTVLFVSHNITAIQTLCSKCVLLDHGRVDLFGTTASVVGKYLANVKRGVGLIHSDMKCLSLLKADADYELKGGNECIVKVRLQFQSTVAVHDLHIDFGLENKDDVRILQVMPNVRGEMPYSVEAGSTFSLNVEVVSTELAPGEYFCTVYAHSRLLGVLLHQSNIRLFRIAPSESNRECMSVGFTAVLLPRYKTHIDLGGG